MAWQRFHNRTGFPINLCFTNAGIIYNDIPTAPSSPSPMCKNNVLKYDEFFSPGVGYDLHVFYSTDQTYIDPKTWNPGAIANVVAISTGVIAVVAGVVAIPFTLGASVPLIATGLGVSEAAIAGAGLALGIGSGVTGATGVAAGIAASAVAGLSNPAVVTGLFGANDHNFYIDGGVTAHAVEDKDGKKYLVVDGTKPLTVSYINCQSGQKYEYGGYTVP